jgi:hypothetical protein
MQSTGFVQYGFLNINDREAKNHRRHALTIVSDFAAFQPLEESSHEGGYWTNH